ncbi:MAG: DUF2845 domain-containing protein [Steroidobacteraceae bacterium]
MRSPAILISLASLLPLAAAADSMRCGKWVVNETMTTAEILHKCGEPQNKEVSKEDVFSNNPQGFVTKRGEQVTERWYYKHSPGALTMLVKIIDGKIISIERAE